MNRLKNLAINDEGFAFEPLTGESFTINEAGRLIIKALIKNLPHEEICRIITEELDALPEEAGRDITDFIERLTLYKLI